jgi:hypothetical protein
MNILDIDSNWETIAQFALSFNGYKFVKGGPVELDALWAKTVLDPDNATIDELRACLFLLQRAGRFCGDEGSPFDLEEARAILFLMKSKQEKQV